VRPQQQHPDLILPIPIARNTSEPAPVRSTVEREAVSLEPPASDGYLQFILLWRYVVVPGFGKPSQHSSPISSSTDIALGRARDGLYEPVLADSEREAVADLLQYLENVSSDVPSS
jgi:hypothetical protein